MKVISYNQSFGNSSNFFILIILVINFSDTFLAQHKTFYFHRKLFAHVSTTSKIITTFDCCSWGRIYSSILKGACQFSVFILIAKFQYSAWKELSFKRFISKNQHRQRKPKLLLSQWLSVCIERITFLWVRMCVNGGVSTQFLGRFTLTEEDAFSNPSRCVYTYVRTLCVTSILFYLNLKRALSVLKRRRPRRWRQSAFSRKRCVMCVRRRARARAPVHGVWREKNSISRVSVCVLLLWTVNMISAEKKRYWPIV